jgi:hypothetical protein
LPDVDLDVCERFARDVDDLARDEQLGPRGRGANDGSSVLRPRRIGSPKRAQQRCSGLGRAGLSVIQETNQRREANRVGEEDSFVMAVVSGLSDSIEKIDADNRTQPRSI